METKNIVLDGLRGFLSVYVVLGHWILAAKHLHPGIEFIFSFGQEAVMIFFILSGFVIHASWARSSEKRLQSYFIKRFRRIYFPLFISILVSLIIVRPDKFPWRELVGNLLMLQDFEGGKPGTHVNGFLGNAPLWSLSYEWGFYVLFPFLFSVLFKNSNRVYLIGSLGLFAFIAYIAFPNHLLLIPAYLILWWTGVELSILYANRIAPSLSNLKKIFFVLGGNLILLVGLCVIYKVNGTELRPGIYPFLFLRHFIFCFFVLFMVTAWSRIGPLAKLLLQPFSLVAPLSYTMYVFHYILLVQLKTGLEWFLDVPVKLLLLLTLSYITEIKLQPLFNQFIPVPKANVKTLL